MKIIKYKRTSKGRYVISFDEGNEITLFEDVIINNNLLLKNEIDLDLLDKVLEENRVYESFDKAVSYIEKKLRTEEEIREYLKKYEYDDRLIESTINKLKEDRLINDNNYVEAYVNTKVNLTLFGPYKIKRELENLKIDVDIVDKKLNTIDESVWMEKLKKSIDKKMKSLSNKSSKFIKDKLRIDLYNLGYDKEMIEKSLSNIIIDEDESLRKETIKAYNKYSKKYVGNELLYKIKSYLYSKGYRSDNIDLDI